MNFLKADHQPEDGELILACSEVLNWWEGGAAPARLHWYMINAQSDGMGPQDTQN